MCSVLRSLSFGGDGGVTLVLVVCCCSSVSCAAKWLGEVVQI